jgi:transcriptional regulator with XRE-family HTH domain
MPTAATAFGRRLREYRQSARLSQLELGLRANVSARHISFIETGRSQPSREMVLQLARTLDVPLRDRNLLLTSAGFAERFGESSLGGGELAGVRQALDLMLEKQEPWPAMVFNARWELVAANGAAHRLVGWIFGPAPPVAAGGSFLELLFSDVMSSVVENWEEVAAESIARIRREADAGLAHPDVEAFLEKALDDPAVQAAVAGTPDATVGAPLVPVMFRRDDVRLTFFTTVTTFGTPQDITLQEIRIESFFPADDVTGAWLEDARA